MKARPIIFSAAMVRALLAGTKSQTRRVVRLPKDVVEVVVDPGGTIFGPGPYIKAYRHDGCDPPMYPRIRCPYGYPGDRLWVRETWQALHVSVNPETGHGEDIDVPTSIPKDSRNGWKVAYAATDPQADEHRDDRGFSWRPGIHMPRWASRITLEITQVRAQRLHDITEEDALAEGMDPIVAKVPTARDVFRITWDDINGRAQPLLDDDGEPVLDDNERPIMIAPKSWDSNPWVWAVTFKRIEEAG